MLSAALVRNSRQQVNLARRVLLPGRSAKPRIAPQLLPHFHPGVSRFSVPFSSNAREDENETLPPKKEAKKDSLRDTVNRITHDDDNSKDKASDNQNDILRTAITYWDSFQTHVTEAWDDLVRSGKPKDINKKIVDAAGEKPKKYTGPIEIMVIDESENLTAWERMQRRLTEAPIIQDILEKTHVVLEKSGAKKAKEKLDHLNEDAREAWETSQNPWVYRASSVYDTLTAESEFAVAVRELRVLDPAFDLEEWKVDVVEHTLPSIMRYFLKGDIDHLEPWLGEGVYKRLAAEIKARQQEGVQIDTHVLGIMNSEILACELDEVNKGSPIILLHFMCQQINCVRSKKDDKVVEGSEDDIRANSYVCAFQREYNEEEGELQWKIVDFRFNGAIAYI